MIKTVSLDMAKLLKENGFRQDTSLIWAKPFDINNNFTGDELEVETNDWLRYQGMQHAIFCAAPTTDELLEELPEEIETIAKGSLTINKLNNKYEVLYDDGLERLVCLMICTNESLSEALASMWLYLKREGLLK